MPKGLKATSSPIAVSFDLQETLANTFTQSTVELALNALDNEVFVVLAVDLNVSPPDALAGIDTSVLSSLTSTSQTAVANLSDSNCIANANLLIRAAGFVDGGVAISTGATETPPTTLDYIAIISTNDFFIQTQGVGNGAAKGMSGRMYGVRARADASVYAALVQSEVLSA